MSSWAFGLLMLTLLNLQASEFGDFAFLVLPAGKLAVFFSFSLSF